VCCCRRKDNVDETLQSLRSKGLQVSGVVCHVGNAQHRSDLIKQTVQVRGPRRSLHAWHMPLAACFVWDVQFGVVSGQGVPAPGRREHLVHILVIVH
jgi:hypothetical protein